MKKIFTLLFILFAFVSCSSDDDDANPVAGNWKLIFSSSLDKGFENLSTKNVIYQFDNKSTLTINTDGVLEKHQYRYEVGYLSGGYDSNEKRIPLVIIDNTKWTYSISAKGEMVLNTSYFDGPILTFTKQ